MRVRAICHRTSTRRLRHHVLTSAARRLSSSSSSSSSPKIAIAMSGGVDSAVVAHLLSQQFPLEDLIGIHMSNWDFHEERGDISSMTGCWEQDWKDARSVADHLNIPIRHVSFQAEYWNDVFAPYCQHVEQSFTPNPDVDCNRYIKFGVLKNYLWERFGIQRLATGHYARLWDRRQTATTPMSKMPDCLEEALDETDSTVVDYLLGNVSGRESSPAPILMAAQDRTKDQSYFLSGVPGWAFSDVLFPLGDFYKSAPFIVVDQNNYESRSLSVREMALDAQLPNATKRDSMGICFVGKRNHGEFINDYIAPSLSLSLSSSSEGSKLRCINVEDQSVIATFDPASNPALAYATVGQGAKISGASQKWFVVQRQQGNTLMVCPGTKHPALYADCLFLQSQDMNWLCGGGLPPPFPFQAKCRIRHLQPLVNCEIRQGPKIGEIVVHLDVPLRGIAPGQVCAFYAGGKDGDLVCLGGGPIDRQGETYWERQQDLPAIVHPAGHNDLSYAQGG